MGFENLFQTATMLEVIDETEAFKSKNFLTTTFFPVGGDVEGETLHIDIKKGARRIAPMIHPKEPGRLVEKRPYQTNKVSPGYIRLLDEVDAADLLTRGPGETIYRPGRAPVQIAAERLAESLYELIDMIQRRIEVQAREALVTGKVTIIDEDAQASDTLDFQRDADNDITLTGNDLWTDTTNSDPLGDILDWKEQIGESTGQNLDKLVLGSTVLKAFLNHPKVQALLDNRRTDIGYIKQTEISPGVSHYGEVHGVQIYAYHEWYLTLAGVSTPMVPKKDILGGCSRAKNQLHYGAIRDPNAGVIAVPYYPVSWPEYNPPARLLRVDSAPLCALHQPDTTLRVQAVA